MSKPYAEYQSMYKNYTVASCTCHKPDNVVRFGECVLCLDKRCFSGWVFTISKKMACTFIGIRRISKVGPALWYEFLDHLIMHFWRRVAEGNAKGISVYDIDSGLRSFLVRHKDLFVEEPSLEVTQPPEYDDEQPDDRKGNNLTEIASHLVVQPVSPARATWLARLANKITDPLLALYWAGELDLREVSMLADCSPVAWEKYQAQALLEVRGGEETRSQIEAT